MNSLLTMAMLAAGGVMVWAVLRHRSGSAWGGPVAVAAVAVVLLCVALQVVPVRRSSQTRRLLEYEQRYRRLAGQRLGADLAAKVHGGSALIITGPGVTDPARDPNADFIAGLREGFGQTLAVAAVVSPEVPEALRRSFAAQMPPGAGTEGDGMGLPPPELWFTAQVMDELVAAHSDGVTAVVSLIGLPAEAARLRFLRDRNRPALAVINGSAGVVQGVTQGLVAAAIAWKPVADDTWSKPPPKDDAAAFDRRWLLLTPETIAALVTKYPDLAPR